MRGSARIYDVRMAQFVPKIETLSHIMSPRASQDLRSPSLIMVPEKTQFNKSGQGNKASDILNIIKLMPAPLHTAAISAILLK